MYISDSFLRMRDKTDHEATAMMKAQFMSLWDGKHFFNVVPISLVNEGPIWSRKKFFFF